MDAQGSSPSGNDPLRMEGPKEPDSKGIEKINILLPKVGGNLSLNQNKEMKKKGKRNEKRLSSTRKWRNL